MSVKYISYILKTTLSLVKFEKQFALNYYSITEKILSLYESDMVFNSVVNVDTKLLTITQEFQPIIQSYLSQLDIYLSDNLTFEDESVIRETITPYRNLFFNQLVLFLLSFANIQCGSVLISINEDTTTIIETCKNIINNDNTLLSNLGYEVVDYSTVSPEGAFTFLTTKNRSTILNCLEVQATITKNIITFFSIIISNLDYISSTINYLHATLMINFYNNLQLVNLYFDQFITELNRLNTIMNTEHLILTEDFTITYLYIIYNIIYYTYNINVLLTEIYTYIDDN